MDSQNDYWLGRWARGETGWHQTEVEPELIAAFKGLAPTRVLVPLCGKSLDLVWLASRGHEVVGVELSEKACREFFVEQKMTPEISTQGSFQVFSAGRFTIFCGDFFTFTSGLLGKVGAFYDRAALIALPPDLRSRYVEQIKALIKTCADPLRFHFLQLILEREPGDSNGPPFSITGSELRDYYQDAFDLRLLKREEIETDRAGKRVYQSVFELRPR